MAEPRFKRPKISRGEDDYLPGNITEIELHNFMTYNQLKCKPASRLNLVIGPNGSGKSSLVCAIALGLGGEPQLLGRASSIGAYVKRGEESGHIKISLRGSTKEEKITITRRIDTRNKSEWLFNGKMVPKKEIIEIVQRFNIQVNNLTQFLPQDRVCEFAKLSPVQLLEETEKAVGDPQLPLQHCALVDKSYELKKLELTVKQNMETLNQLKALNVEQEKDVKRVHQREELLKKVESMKKKLPWLRYDLKKAEYMAAKEQEDDAKKKLNDAATTLNELKEPIEKLKQEKAVQDAASKKVSSIINNLSKRRMEMIENENQLGAKLRGKYNEMDDLRRQEESRQQRISKAKEDLAAAEADLANLPRYEPPQDELERLRSELAELVSSKEEKRWLKSEMEQLLNQKRFSLRRCNDRVKEMENKNNKLLQALRNNGAENIAEAYNWVQQHRDELNKEVFGPVLLEVNVSNCVHASYLEGHIPFYIWKSFITQDSRDRDYLAQKLKSFEVPIINFVGNAGPPKETFQIHALGIYSRLDQVFEAPPAVKEVLTNQFGLDNSYIGSKDTDEKADEVSKLGILDFWTPENHYRWSVSRYGGHVSASMEPVSKSRLFLDGSDVGQIEKLRAEKKELEDAITNLEESCKSLQLEYRYLEDEEAECRKKREEIINIKTLENRKRRDLESLIDQRKRKLKAMETENDVDDVIAKLSEEASNLNLQRFQCAIELKSSLIEAVSYKRSFAERHLASLEFDAKIREAEGSLKQQEKFAQQAAMRWEYCKKEVDDCRQQLLAAKKHAESIAIITPELREAFLEMPTTIEDLEAAIQDYTSQANSILFLNHNILEEYENRQHKIEAIKMKLDADEKELTRCIEEISSLKEKWLPTLRTLIAQINETFSRNFQEMAVAGEVSLDEHEKDFDKFGILIKVKFRETGQLQVLSAHHQSGGERSVSTILYLVSLQDLTHCPFRVVDEINQGMDPINERKMFQQLVRAATQPNTPQCFLLTPKLLPELEYGEACSILDLMNGPWIADPAR
ncbi:RecF/RecN/SMC, N-terminal, partial [Dillenia turbinata]